MEIRRYQDSDLEQVATLFINTIRHVNCRHYSPEQIAAWAPQTIDAPHWRVRLSTFLVWVAETDSQIVGFSALRPDGYIHFQFTHHQFQRQGVARALYSEMESEARRRGIHLLFTDASITARPFFETMGFCLLRERQVKARGVMFLNYAMEKRLKPAAQNV